MKHRQSFSFILAVFLFMFAVLGNASPAAAGMGPRRMEKPPHRHPYRGSVVTLPELLTEIILHAGVRYAYHDGYFYKKGPIGHVIVDAPVGAVVPDLTPGYKTIIINGAVYYYYNDTYYLRGRTGYVVVDDPVYQIAELPQAIKVKEAAPPAEVSGVSGSGDAYTVYIPGPSGEYIPVTIKESGKGFIGPQGEYYPDFPSVKQLKLMYGKKSD